MKLHYWPYSAFAACLAASVFLITHDIHAVPVARSPVIISTDIGDDIDDTWALALALRSPELDIKLVVGDFGNPLPRARLIAKFLEAAQRTDISVGVGIEAESKSDLRQAKWIEGYDLDRYPGKVYRDGVQALIDIIMASKETVTLLCIGPLPNIAEALRREPRIAQKARFVGMHGSVRLGYGRNPKPSAEWNVRANPAACRAALSAPWDITITPLDTCGLIQLKGESYARISNCTNPAVKTLVENYRVWTEFNAAKNGKVAGPITASSTLFDCVAIYLAINQDLCVMEKLNIRVDDDGFTREDPAARQMNVATAWKDLLGFEAWLVQRLTAQ
jgi:inosine-uridine nucleoside N-ribohydrolase